MKAQAPSRERILKASASLFRKQGFHGTSIRDIASGEALRREDALRHDGR
ncbi:MAG: TetR family transcriptional regulator [Elusimicrobiota bacterium]